jgi:hypothetical protein
VIITPTGKDITKTLEGKLSHLALNTYIRPILKSVPRKNAIKTLLNSSQCDRNLSLKTFVMKNDTTYKLVR